MKEQKIKKGNLFYFYPQKNAGGRNRTGTEFEKTPRDFKSLASTYSATPANLFKEATSGFEPLHRGFADHSLTTWVRRL